MGEEGRLWGGDEEWGRSRIRFLEASGLDMLSGRRKSEGPCSIQLKCFFRGKIRDIKNLLNSKSLRYIA